jgi:hypothetical protein
VVIHDFSFIKDLLLYLRCLLLKNKDLTAYRRGNLRHTACKMNTTQILKKENILVGK